MLTLMGAQTFHDAQTYLAPPRVVHRAPFLDAGAGVDTRVGAAAVALWSPKGGAASCHAYRTAGESCRHNMGERERRHGRARAVDVRRGPPVLTVAHDDKIVAHGVDEWTRCCCRPIALPRPSGSAAAGARRAGTGARERWRVVLVSMM